MRIMVIIGIVVVFFAGLVYAEGTPREAIVPPPGLPFEKAASSQTSELLISLASEKDVKAFARDHHLTLKYALRSDPSVCVYAAGNAEIAAAGLKELADDNRVRSVWLNRPTCYVRMAFVPNDPYFHKNTPSSGWPGQWHLINEYVAGLDARVQGAWNRNVTGSGVTFGIVDDSLQTTHPDLAPNYVAADSWDFGQNDGVPDPVYSDDQHGISVAGVAAARGGNGIGVTGAAPHAGLAGLRIDFVNQTTAMFVDATQYHSSGTNTNIKVKNHSYGVSVPFMDGAAEVAALVNSAAAGTVHCFAAGNERDSHESYFDENGDGSFTPDVDYAVDGDANKKDDQNSPECICVAALGSDGKFSYYSNWGACLFVCAPSNDSGGYGITTTDRMGESAGYNGTDDTFPDGDYTSMFGGTSSATPLVAGVMTLVKQVQPALNIRFAKHLLVRTSDVVDSTDATAESDGGWKTNGAGFKFNQNYGFGLIDADGLTLMAAQYSGVTALTTATSGTVSVNSSIPDNNTTGISRTFTITGTQPVEDVLVQLYITHSWRGDLQAFITSPSGTTSRLFSTNGADSFNAVNWTFCTNAFWGENPSGTWTIKVADYFAQDTGTWRTFNATVRMGTLVPVTGDPPAITQQPLSQMVPEGRNATFTVQASGTPVLSYRWQKEQVDLIDDGRISGTSTNTLQISNVVADDGGSYRCVVTNNYGSASSLEATLTLSPPPSPCWTEDFEQGQGWWNVVYGIWQTSATPASSQGQSWISPDGMTTQVARRFTPGEADVLTLRYDFYSNSSTASRYFGGFQTLDDNDLPVIDSALIRIGSNNTTNYVLHYWTTALVAQNTGVPVTAGWHNVKIMVTLSAQKINWQLDGASGQISNPNVKRPNGVVLGYSTSNGTTGAPDTSAWFDNVQVEGCITPTVPPTIVAAVSRKTHGSAGDFDLEVTGSSAVENRQNGPTWLRVTFDKAIQGVGGLDVTDIALSSGAVSSVAIDGVILDIQLTAVSDQSILAVYFPGIADAGNAQAVVTDRVCVGVLAGDAGGDGATNIFDLLAVRNAINLPVSGTTFRSDVTADGVINVLDMLAIKSNLNKKVSGSCP